MSVYIRKITASGLLVVALLCAGAFALPTSFAFADDGSLQVAALPDTPEQEGWYQDDADSSWHYWGDPDGDGAFEWLTSQWIETAKAPSVDPDSFPAGVHRYWLDKNGAMAKGRFVNPKKALDAEGSAYLAYATDNGYVLTASSPLKPVEVKGFGWVLPIDKKGHLLAGARKRVAPAGKNAGDPGTKVYLARANGRLETGNATTHILGTSAYDKDKAGNPQKRYYYINPKTHSAVVTSKPVEVKGYGWVYPIYRYGQLMVGRTVVKSKHAVYLANAKGKLATGNKQGFLRTNAFNTKNKNKLLYYINPKTHAIIYGKPVKVANFGYVYAPNGGGYLLTECKKIDSKHVLLVEKNGRICTKRGWLNSSAYASSGARYWVEPTTANKALVGARLGTFKVNGNTYTTWNNASLKRNMWYLGGTTYYWLDAKTGKFNRSDVVTSLYRRAQGYWSPSRYLIMVDIDNPRTVVFEGWQGNWSVKYIWNCCTGAPETPTVCGTFSVGSRGYSFGEGNGYSCYYWTQISGDYLFHTRLYYPYTWNIMSAAMGRRCSHGCVRLMDDAAYWIWTQVPSGTTVACVY